MTTNNQEYTMNAIASKLRTIFFLCTLFGMTLGRSMGQDDPAIFTGALEQSIGRVLATKTKAMKLPSMRSEGGEFAKEAELELKEVAEQASKNERLTEIKKLENNDIRAKVVVWALDRAERPEIYKRFAKYYIDSPSKNEARDYFDRPFVKAGKDIGLPKELTENRIPIIWSPNPVDAQDRIEDYRLVMEYCFFMPPSGNGFARDYGRRQMADVLLALGSKDRSQGVFIADAGIFLSSHIPWNPQDENSPKYHNDLGGNSEGLLALVNIPTRTTFKALTVFQVNPLGKTLIHEIMNKALGETPERSLYESNKLRYDEWKKIAEQDWDSPEEKKFAYWLQSIAPPTPSKEVPRSNDPSDPF